ncbi:hypothetical protein D3C79_822280 [compost metagenome]
MGHGDAVQADLALHQVHGPSQGLQQGRLAGAVAPEHGNAFARLDIQLADVQYGRGLLAVAEVGLAQAVLAANRRQVHAGFAFGVVDRGLHQLVQPLQGHLGLLPAGQHMGQLRQWRHHP